MLVPSVSPLGPLSSPVTRVNDEPDIDFLQSVMKSPYRSGEKFLLEQVSSRHLLKLCNALINVFTDVPDLYLYL